MQLVNKVANIFVPNREFLVAAIDFRFHYFWEPHGATEIWLPEQKMDPKPRPPGGPENGPNSLML